MYIYMHVCTYIHLYIHIYYSQHVDLSNINALCLGGGTRCWGLSYQFDWHAINRSRQ